MINIIKFIQSLFGKKEEPGNGKGLIFSLPDYRDIPMSAVLKDYQDLPAEYEIPYRLTIKNQGSTSQCVAYSGSTMKEEKEMREQNNIVFDPDWLYKECKKIDGIPNVQGTYFRTVLSVLKNKGAKPLGGKESDAEKYRIGAYVRIDNDYKARRQAIFQWGVVLTGFTMTNEGWATKDVRPPRNGENKFGHAISEIGWKEKNKGQNSWGNWGENGYFWIPNDYTPIESWAILTDLPNNWKELLQGQENKPQYTFKENLFVGIRNDDVRFLQDALKWLGLMSQEQVSTGYFGEITLNAVKLFQLRYGLPTTGYFGPLSQDKINQLLL